MKIETINKLVKYHPHFVVFSSAISLYGFILFLGSGENGAWKYEYMTDIFSSFFASVFAFILFFPLIIVPFTVIYPVTAPFYILLLKLKEKEEESPEEFDSKSYTINILKKLIIGTFKLSILSIILYIPCLAFIFAINSETELELNHFLASSILTIPALFISLIIYSVLKWLKNATIIKSAEISLVVEILLYVSCALLMIYMNPGKKIDYSLLSSSALLWAMIQPVVFLIYFVFKALRRPIPEEKPSALEAKEK